MKKAGRSRPRNYGFKTVQGSGPAGASRSLRTDISVQKGLHGAILIYAILILGKAMPFIANHPLLVLANGIQLLAQELGLGQRHALVIRTMDDQQIGLDFVDIVGG